MFTNFTWWQFFGTFLLFLVIYYPIILSLYFRQETKLFWRKFVVAPGAPNASYGLVEKEYIPQPDLPLQTSPTTDEAVAKMIANLMDDVRNGMKAAADSGASKDQLFALLKNVLAKYSQLKKTGQRVQINEFIIQEAVHHNYTIHMAQVYALWANASDVNE